MSPDTLGPAARLSHRPGLGTTGVSGPFGVTGESLTVQAYEGVVVVVVFPDSSARDRPAIGQRVFFTSSSRSDATTFPRVALHEHGEHRGAPGERGRGVVLDQTLNQRSIMRRGQGRT